MNIYYLNNDLTTVLIPKKLHSYFNVTLKDIRLRPLHCLEYADIAEFIISTDFNDGKPIELKTHMLYKIGWFRKDLKSKKEKVAFISEKNSREVTALSYVAYRKIGLSAYSKKYIEIALFTLFDLNASHITQKK